MENGIANKTDGELFEAISRQDIDAFNALYGRYNRLLYKRVYGRLEDAVQSQEIMQDFWITIWTKPDFVKTADDGSAKGFLYHYLAYRVLDAIRKENFKRIASATHTPLEQLEEKLSYLHVSEEYEIKELEVLIDAALRDLPGQTAEVFILHWRKGYSLKETADLLHLNERTVRLKSKESIAALRRMIENGDIDATSFKIMRDTSLVIVYVVFLSDKMMP
ncbi:MAG: sigma-70 family RNA polymerase sigma factor [Paludibacteraceae bacterium]